MEWGEEWVGGVSGRREGTGTIDIMGKARDEKLQF